MSWVSKTAVRKGFIDIKMYLARIPGFYKHTKLSI